MLVRTPSPLRSAAAKLGHARRKARGQEHRGAPRKVTPEVERIIIRRYLGGQSIRTIAGDLKLGKNAVWSALVRNDVKRDEGGVVHDADDADDENDDEDDDA